VDHVVVRPLTVANLAAAEDLVKRRLGSRWQARLGELVDVLALPGFIAYQGSSCLGVLTYQVKDNGCELVAIAAVEGQRGIGTRLLEALRSAERARIRLVTTNDNLDALRFYQRRGFRLIDLGPGGVERSRAVKAQIPATGAYGIPLRDELILEWRGKAGG